LKVNYWRSDNHQYSTQSFNAACKAYHDYNKNFNNHEFEENLNKTKKFLSNYGFSVSPVTMPEKAANHYRPLHFELDSIDECVQITDLLNKKYTHHLFIILPKDNNSTILSNFIIPTGMLLLQTISQTLYCSFLVFSTRASPVLVKPFLENYT
jgi:hypothetical protein